jgi:hypothetical protein
MSQNISENIVNITNACENYVCNDLTVYCINKCNDCLSSCYYRCIIDRTNQANKCDMIVVYILCSLFGTFCIFAICVLIYKKYTENKIKSLPNTKNDNVKIISTFLNKIKSLPNTKNDNVNIISTIV